MQVRPVNGSCEGTQKAKKEKGSGEGSKNIEISEMAAMANSSQDIPAKFDCELTMLDGLA